MTQSEAPPSQENPAGYTPVTVVVMGPDGATVQGAEVRVTPGSPSGDHFVADEQGHVLLGLVPGTYEIQVTAQDLATAEQKVVVTETPQTVSVNLAAAAPAENGPAETEPAPESPGAVPLNTNAGNNPAAPGVLTITAGPEERGVFTPATLKDYPHRIVTVADPRTKQSRRYSGVPLMDLLSHLGVSGNLMGPALAKYLVASGSDGFEAVLSLAEVDPRLHAGTVLVADAMDGKPLDAKTGPFLLVVSEDKQPVRSVRNLVSIDVRSAE
jgi:hypothetical protein